MSRRAVWKFVLSPGKKTQSFEVPSPNKVLHVGVANGDICVWLEANAEPNAPKTARRFRVFATGELLSGATGNPPVPDDSMWHYVGTAILPLDPDLVFHVYQF